MRICVVAFYSVAICCSMTLYANEIFTTVIVAPSIGSYVRTGFEDSRGKTSDGRLSGLDELLCVGTDAGIGFSNSRALVFIKCKYIGVLSPKDKLSYENDEVATARFSSITTMLSASYKLLDKNKFSIDFYNGGRIKWVESNLTLKNESNVSTTYIDGIHIYRNYFCGPSIDLTIYNKKTIIVSYYRYIGYNPSDYAKIEYSFLHPDSDDRFSKLCLCMELEKSKGFSYVFVGLSFYGAFWGLFD